ncbi:MAG TPA: DNA primase [Gemmatimonadales bacterium]|nr:DNA primase [Gemmatimonadales bacterium]
MIPDEVIEQVRDGADLVALVGESVDLKRTGADYRGPCPFHGGTHRNFAVIPKKGMYYCYVCHAAGDVFTYFMKRFGMDYPTAVREVARRSGITIPEQPSRAGPDPREPLFGAVAAAHDWFVRQLVESPAASAAREYLAGRGIDRETAAPLGFGFAPRGPAFLDEMTRLGIDAGTLLEAGLVIRREDGSVAPRFRGRLLIPIHDLRGRVVGFGGRILGPGEPKYLNSPETPIFQKGRLLYNLHQARNAIRKEQTAILVEGYFDVIRLVLAGVEHVVAPLGTALTPDQAALLRRYATQAIILYDSDQAGLRATFRAADELLRHEVRVRVATMPPGEDPDTLARAGGRDAVEAVLHDAVDVIERKIQLLERKGWFDGLEHRRDALDRLLPTIRAARDPITRELYITRVAERSGVSRRVLEEEVGEAGERAADVDAGAGRPPGRAPIPSHVPPAPAAPRRLGAKDEWELLRALVVAPELLARAGKDLPGEWIEGKALREIFDAMVGVGSPLDPTAVIGRLAPETQLVWSKLVADARALAGQDVVPIYEGARQALEARPLLRRWIELRDRLRLASDGAEQDALFRQQLETRREVESRYPRVAERFHWLKRGRTPGRTGRG